ncbi:hypothetical protein GBAR_LOCUS25844 [Geodia barretti]|uniref:Uncharacterized protein n=1 Tax=Geodia barretti TaxID=519541 RepID=A0AA35X768_GEOBA|nr:hypothetical protein GBAR_LOCUS25844 [Geodia barretti]
MKKLFTGPQSELRIWTAARFLKDDYVALLMCVAVDGYHSLTSYQWRKDGENILMRSTPYFMPLLLGVMIVLLVQWSQNSKVFF